MFRFLLISIVELKNGYFCLVLPVFWAFPVLGPIITSLASSRSNTDGPSDRKCPKNGQNLAEIPIFLLNNRNRQKPKNFNATTSYSQHLHIIQGYQISKSLLYSLPALLSAYVVILSKADFVS